MSRKNTGNPFTKKILDFIDLHPKCPRKTRRLAKVMSIGDRDYPLFREAFRELRRTGKLSPKKRDARTLIGRFKANQRGFGFVTPQGPELGDDAGDVFIPLGSTAGALSGDMVLVELWTTGTRGGDRGRGGSGKRVQGEIIEIVERGLRQVVGTLEHVDGGWFLEPDGGQLTTPVIIDSLPSDVTDTNGKPPPRDLKVLVEITEYPTGPGMLPVGAVTEILGHEGVLETETMAIILAHELPFKFSEAALREASNAVSSFSPLDRNEQDPSSDRVDLSERVIVTIDPEEARDFDDALSIYNNENGTFELGVHIADVAHFVPEGCALDLEARARGTSTYFPRRVVPMLPQGLSSGVCALKPGEPRYAISVFITYDEQGQVLDRSAIRSLITSRRRLTYAEAQRICDGAAEDDADEVTFLVRSLSQLARIVRERRTRDGMLSLDLPEVELILDREGRVSDALPKEHLFTHTLIEMFMVEANEAIAELLTKRGVPVIRRVHPRPTAENFGLLQRLAQMFGRPLPQGPPTRAALQRLIESVRDEPVSHAINLALLRSLKKARYSIEEVGHFALASRSYCHFTSPIRRYPDLIVHRMVSWHLLDKRRKQADDREAERGAIRDNEERLQELAEHCSETERRAEAAEWELRQVLLLQHLSEKVGERFTGVITGVTSFGPFVQSPRFLIEGLIPRDTLGGWWEVDTGKGTMVDETTGTTLRLGDPVEVTIARVDVAQRHLDLRLERPLSPTASKPRRQRGRPPSTRGRSKAPSHRATTSRRGGQKKGSRKR